MKPLHAGTLNGNGGTFDDDNAPRLFVVSQIRLLRDGIARLLRTNGVRAIALASEKTALADIRHATPDVAILDVSAPSVFQLMRELTERHPTVRLLALGVGESDAEVLACAKAGAAGYLPLESGIDDLMTAIANVRRDELVCSPHVAAFLFRHATRAGAPMTGESATLTAREQQVLALVERGFSNKEIAAHLNIGLTTVKNHVHHILEKLHVRRRGAAAARVRGAVVMEGPAQFEPYSR